MSKDTPQLDRAESAGELSDPGTRTVRRLARIVLAAFVITFLLSRILVILIMSRKIPDLFLHVGRTHVHHLNYGIFLLSGIGYFLIFTRPSGKPLSVAALVYGVGLGLTFDEFGMWVHLGGSYWQRASFDAVVVVAALLGLVAFAPALTKFRPRHWVTASVLFVLVLTFVGVLTWSLRAAGRHYLPRLIEIEQNGPP